MREIDPDKENFDLKKSKVRAGPGEIKRLSQELEIQSSRLRPKSLGRLALGGAAEEAGLGTRKARGAGKSRGRGEREEGGSEKLHFRLGG